MTLIAAGCWNRLLFISTKDIFDDRYEIVDEIGHGGMGRVFKAIQTDLDRTVAIKILAETALSADSFSRFEREALIMSSLNHPAICCIYGFGRSGGLPYLVMEYIDGVSLQSEFFDRKPLAIDRTLNIISQLCVAMKYAHDAGIVHRDLKPANIMLVNQNSVETIKVIDLGLARLLPESGKQQQQKLTETGTAIGSVLYMSPEQCSGRPADQRSDVYSIGVILYQCLTGQVPFEAETAIAALVAHTAEPPKKLADLNPDANLSGLQSVIYKALAKDPDQRYQSADEMLTDIELIKTGKGQQMTSALRLEERVAGTAARGTRRRPDRKPLVVATTLGCFMFLAMFYTLWFAKSSEKLYSQIAREATRAQQKLRSERQKYEIDRDVAFRAAANDFEPTAARFLPEDIAEKIEDCLQADQRDHLLDQSNGARKYMRQIQLSSYLLHSDPHFEDVLRSYIREEDRALQLGRESDFSSSFLALLINSASCAKSGKDSRRMLLNVLSDRSIAIASGSRVCLLGWLALHVPKSESLAVAKEMLSLSPIDNTWLVKEGAMRLMLNTEISDPVISDRLFAFQSRCHNYGGQYLQALLATHFAFHKDWDEVLKFTNYAERTFGPREIYYDCQGPAMDMMAYEMKNNHAQALEILRKIEAVSRRSGVSLEGDFFFLSPRSAFQLHNEQAAVDRINKILLRRRKSLSEIDEMEKTESEYYAIPKVN